MRPVGNIAAVVVTGALALLLIIYVFTGSTSVRPQNSPHCTSVQALDQIKSELFRRAGQVRQADGEAFANVAHYTIVRAASRMVRQHHPGSDAVTCTGSIALDLPPGVAVVGERRSLASEIVYDL